MLQNKSDRPKSIVSCLAETLQVGEKLGFPNFIPGQDIKPANDNDPLPDFWGKGVGQMMTFTYWQIPQTAPGIHCLSNVDRLSVGVQPYPVDGRYLGYPGSLNRLGRDSNGKTGSHVPILFCGFCRRRQAMKSIDP